MKYSEEKHGFHLGFTFDTVFNLNLSKAAYSSFLGSTGNGGQAVLGTRMTKKWVKKRYFSGHLVGKKVPSKHPSYLRTQVSQMNQGRVSLRFGRR